MPDTAEPDDAGPTVLPDGRRADRTVLSTRGRCLLAAGIATAACAVPLAERDLLRVGAFAAVLPLLALLLALATRRTVRVQRTLSPHRLPVGAAATVTLQVTGGAAVGPLELVDTAPDAAGPAAPPRFVVPSRARGTAAAVHYRLHPVRRGVHRIGPLVAYGTDPLGLADFARTVPGTDRLLVLPRTVPLRGVPHALGSSDGAHGAGAAGSGQGRSDVLVRPYRSGDELRRVHWRSTARHDELMVRLEERPWRGGVTVLLDRRAGAHRGHGPGASLEWAVTFAASACVHLIDRGEPVELVTEDGAARRLRPVHRPVRTACSTRSPRCAPPPVPTSAGPRCRAPATCSRCSARRRPTSFRRCSRGARVRGTPCCSTSGAGARGGPRSSARQVRRRRSRRRPPRCAARGGRSPSPPAATAPRTCGTSWCPARPRRPVCRDPERGPGPRPVWTGVALLLAGSPVGAVVQGTAWWGYAAGAVALVVAVGLVTARCEVLRPARPRRCWSPARSSRPWRCSSRRCSPDPACWASCPARPPPASWPHWSPTPRPRSAPRWRRCRRRSAMLLLVTVAFGVTAVAVHAIAVGAGAPAATGVLLLAVFAVPAALADELLPAWMLAAAAAGFGLLLLARPGPPAGRPAWRPGASAVAVVAAAVVLALGVGAAAGGVGTAGRFPSTGGTGAGRVGEIGLSPFTALRGELRQSVPAELFRVTGLPRPAYLRALTLSTYVPGRGLAGAPSRRRARR